MTDVATSATMRRVVVTDAGVLVVTAPTPTPAPHEALVATSVVGVCGSDVHAAAGRHPFVSLPYLPGHEVVGVVVAVGGAVTGVLPGQRVTVEPPLPCWACKMCRSGRENLCEGLQFFGCGYPQGGMADQFTIDARRLHAVPHELDDVSAVLIEPLATPVHAARLAGGCAGKTVVVLGAGTIGLLMLAVVRHQQAARIVVTDVLADKRERAQRLGADVVLDPSGPDLVSRIRTELGGSADLVFDCVSIQRTVSDAIALADKGGTVVIVGVPAGEVSIPLPVVQDHQIRIQGSATYLPLDYDESIRMLQAGAVRAGDIVTSQLPLTRAAEAFELSAGGHQVKVVLTV